MESYSLANLITDCEAGASTASDSFDDCAPGLDAADDGGRDLLLEFTSECELGEIEVDPPAVDGAVDAPTVDDAPVPVYVETAFAPLSVPIIVVTAPAIPPVTVRSRLTTDWQMQAARAAVVVRRRTWTIPRPWQAAFSGSWLALPIVPFVYGVIFGGVAVLLATGQLHDLYGDLA